MDANEEEKQEEQGQDRETTEASETTTSSSFQWYSLIDGVSETTRESWNVVWGMGIYEFFNIVAYRNEKSERQKEEIKKWQTKN